jgi:hypothetical protein
MRIEVQQGGAFVGGVGVGRMIVGPGAASQPGDAQGVVIHRMKLQVQQGGGFVNGQGGGQGFGGGGQQAQMSMATEAGRVDYSSNNGDEHLTVADPAGKQLFDGPVNTPDQRKKVPADAVAILKKMVGPAGGVGIQMGGAVNVAGGAGGNAGAMPVFRSPLADLVAKLGGGQSEEFSRQVGDYAAKVSISGEGRHRATITGKDGKVAFTGPVDTADQWKAIKDVPAEVVEAAKSMDASLAKEFEAKKAEAGPTSAPDGK